MGKKKSGAVSKNEDLDAILAEVQKVDEKKKEKQEKQQVVAAAAPAGDAVLSTLKWKSKKEMDILISENAKKKNWPSTQTSPEPTVPVTKMYITPADALKKLATKELAPEVVLPLLEQSRKQQSQQQVQQKQNAVEQKTEEQQATNNGEDQNASPIAATAAAAEPTGKKKKKKGGNGGLQLPPIDGEVVEFEVLDREKELEKEAKNEQFENELWKARLAAQCHKSVRKWLQSWVKPGMTMQYITETTENKVRELLGNDGIEGGVGFPMGCSLNNCAAHYTPNAGDPTRLGANDVVKFDIGVHHQGRIIDSAFTMCWNDRYQPLVDACRAATNEGVRVAGIDVRLYEVGAAIQEVMESYEVQLDGKTFQVKCVDNLCGHNILPYTIHGGKSVPIVRIDPKDHYHYQEYSKKMEEFDFFAIETFGSTGRGHIHEEGECSHFSINQRAMFGVSGLSQKEKDLLSLIKSNFGTLPFARRYIDRLNGVDPKFDPKYVVALRSLVNKDIITDYPPLVDIKSCYTGQFEHSLVLRPTSKEIFTRSDDY